LPHSGNRFSSFLENLPSGKDQGVSDVTHILGSLEGGDSTAADQLLPLVYEELRKLAASKMAGESSGHTLQATALVHEAWLRLVGSKDASWENRAHFFAAAAEAMRRVLIDRARSKQAVRHGGGLDRVDLEKIDVPAAADEETLLRVNDSLDALSREDAKVAELVKLRFFAGLSVGEAALALGVTDRTARRYWRFARAWLYDDFGKDGP
jgi:RNA polymerase sigma factor (TIGR02999 family)